MLAENLGHLLWEDRIYEFKNEFKKYCIAGIFIFSSSCDVKTGKDNSQYALDCEVRGWHCNELSKENKKIILSGYEDALQPYLEYFSKQENSDFNSELNRFMYWEAAGLCRKVYSVDPESKVCDQIHCEFIQYSWIGLGDEQLKEMNRKYAGVCN